MGTSQGEVIVIDAETALVQRKIEPSKGYTFLELDTTGIHSLLLHGRTMLAIT